MGWEEVVLGYDVRVAPEQAARAWDEARRAQFLLRVDAPCPLSVDEAVWPRPGAPPPGDGLLEVLTPRFATLEDARAAAESDDVVIAITAWRGPGEPELPAGPAEPVHPDPAWERLGWDVADGVFPSALSNCGYGAEAETWRARWADRLDAHHLLSTLPDAFAFRDASQRRVPEHAPMSVLGLYRVG